MRGRHLKLIKDSLASRRKNPTSAKVTWRTGRFNQLAKLRINGLVFVSVDPNGICFGRAWASRLRGLRSLVEVHYPKLTRDCRRASESPLSVERDDK